MHTIYLELHSKSQVRFKATYRVQSKSLGSLIRVKGRARIFTTVDISAASDMVDYTLLIDVANYIVITMLIILISVDLASIDLSLEECLIKCFETN